MDYIKEMKDCIKMNDIEVAHMIADKILKCVIIDESVSIEERHELVKLYEKVPKWYA